MHSSTYRIGRTLIATSALALILAFASAATLRGSDPSDDIIELTAKIPTPPMSTYSFAPIHSVAHDQHEVINKRRMEEISASRACGSEISLLDPLTNAYQSVSFGDSFPVGSDSRFSSVNRAVTFSEPATEEPCLNLQTHITVQKTFEEVVNNFKGSASGSGAEWGSASAQFEHDFKKTENSLYISILSSCVTDVTRLSGSVEMTSSAEAQCKDDFFKFAASNGYCYVDGIRKASQMSIIVQVSTTDSKETTKMQAEVQTAATEAGSFNGTASASFTNTLKKYSTLTSTYTRGVGQNFDAKIVTSGKIEDIADALDQFRTNLQPMASSVTTQMYSSAGDCEQWNAACLQLVNSDYSDYRKKVNDLYSAYSEASNDPGAYTRTNFAVFVQPRIIFDQRPKVWSGDVGSSPWGSAKQAAPKFATSRDNAKSWMNALDAWWIKWETRTASQQCSNDNMDESYPFSQQLRTDPYLSGRGLPHMTELSKMYNAKPTTACPYAGGHKAMCTDKCPHEVTDHLPGSKGGGVGHNPKSYGYGPAYLCCRGDQQAYKVKVNTFVAFDLQCD